LSGAAVYDPRHHERNVERLSLLTELRAAAEHDELVLYYQPKVALLPGDQHHVEALVRWIHPARGFMAPFDFIPFAEQTGYIKAITLRVMNAAIRQCGLRLRALANLQALRDTRCMLSIDDYGTGYSSLSCLRQMTLG